MAGGMELFFSGSEISKFGNRFFLRNYRIFLQISASEKYFSDSGNAHSIRHQSIPPLSASRLDGPIRANRFPDSSESPDSRESFQGSRTVRESLKALETTTAMKRRKISCSSLLGPEICRVDLWWIF